MNDFHYHFESFIHWCLSSTAERDDDGRAYERTMGDDDDETTTTTTTTGEQRQPPGVQEESKDDDDDVKSHAAEEDEPLNNDEDDDDAEDDDEDYEYYGRRYDDEDATTTTTTNDDAAYAAAYAAYIAQVQAHAQQQVRVTMREFECAFENEKKLNFWNPFFTWMTMTMAVLRARTHTCGISIRVSSRSRVRKLR